MTLAFAERRADLKRVEVTSFVSQNAEIHEMRKRTAGIINSPLSLSAEGRTEIVNLGHIRENPFVFMAVEKGRKRLMDEAALGALLYAGQDAFALLPGVGVGIRMHSEIEQETYFADFWNRYQKVGPSPAVSLYKDKSGNFYWDSDLFLKLERYKRGFQRFRVSFGVKGDISGRMGAEVASKEKNGVPYMTLSCLEAKGAHAPYVYFDLMQTGSEAFRTTARCGNAAMTVERGSAMKVEHINESNQNGDPGGTVLRDFDRLRIAEIPHTQFSVRPAIIEGKPCTFIMADRSRSLHKR